MASDVRHNCYPLTSEPLNSADEIAQVFRETEREISTIELSKDDRLGSDAVLSKVRPGLEELGFEVEGGVRNKISLPLRYRENGSVELDAEVDAYHEEIGCVVEVEAGRGWESNAVHRDIVRTMAIDEAEVLVIALPNQYERKRSTRPHFDEAHELLRALTETERIELPFRIVLIGY